MGSNIRLDRTDFGILSQLQKDARLSNKELAAKVGLAPSSCLERVKRMRGAGVLRGAHVVVDPSVFGIGLESMIAIRIGNHSRELIDVFQREITALPEVIAFYHLAGVNDFLVHVAVRDAEHLRSLVLDAFTTRPEVVHMDTALVFGHEYKWELPNLNPEPV